MPAYVVVQVARHGGKSGGQALASPKLKRLLAEHDAVVLPTPDATGAAGGESPFTTIAVPDMGRANTLASALREMDEIESAYAKPGDELP
jgi:hypothetical protein